MFGGIYAAALMLAFTTLAGESTPSKVLSENGTDPTELRPANIGRTSKTSLLMGKDVKNVQGEKLGGVTDIIVDLAAGRVVAVVISSGGFLGIGNELSIVPPAALRIADGGDSLQLDASKESLRQAPHFKSSEWPDLSKVGYVSSVYSAYKVAPYHDQSGPHQADNTVRNSRDRNGSKPTAFDQGSSQNDLEITTQIRKAIMAKDGLSVNAQNVKIITTNGRVTLRGPVNNAEEKRFICDLAIKATRKESVDDQLEVK